MAPLATSSRAVLRQCARTKLAVPAVATQTTAMQQRRGAAGSADQFKSGSTKIPSFGAYFSKGPSTNKKVFQYFMVGTMGALSAAGAKATVQGKRTKRRR